MPPPTEITEIGRLRYIPDERDGAQVTLEGCGSGGLEMEAGLLRGMG